MSVLWTGCDFAVVFLDLLRYDLWPWTSAVYRLWRDEILYHIWTQSSNPRRSYCDFNIWPNDLECRVTCWAWLWDNFHQVWPVATYPCLNYSVFYADTSCHAVTLTFDPLTLKVHGTPIVTYVIKVHTKFERNRTIPGGIINNFANYCTRYVTLWPSPLISWLWSL